MRIQHDMASLFAWRSLSRAAKAHESSIQVLASGRRINSAADDAAGLSISQRINAQVLGYSQASRNTLDGLSLVNTADGGLGQIMSLLQRGRELAVQAANGVLDPAQKGSIQIELDHVIQEIDRIADTTTFNGRQLLSDGGATAVTTTVTGLRTGWLEQAEQIISTYYGINGNGATVTIDVTAGGGRAGSLKGVPDVGGTLKDIVMTFDAAALSQMPDADRVVARTLAQAMLARNANFVNLDAWFISGSSDLIAGGNELLQRAVAKYGAAAVVSAVGGAWVDDELHQASAYLAVKYLNQQLTLSGVVPTTGLSEMSALLGWLPSGDLDLALTFTLGMNVTSFLTDFQMNGGAFLSGLITSGSLGGSDVGGVHPGDLFTVIPDGGSYSTNPTTSININWNTGNQSDNVLALHVGPNTADQLTVSLAEVTAVSLNLLGLDLTKNAATAIGRFDGALQAVSQARSRMGSAANALEHTININTEAELSARSSYARIVDADYALEITQLTKQQILTSVSASMLTQATGLRRSALRLLLEVPPPLSATPPPTTDAYVP